MSEIMNPAGRPKVQEFEEGLLVTLKMLQINERTNKLGVGKISVL